MIKDDPVTKTVKKRYEWAWNCLALQIAISQAIQVVILIFMIIYVFNTDIPDGEDEFSYLLHLILIYTIPIAAVSYLIANYVSAFIALKVTKACRIRDYFRKPKIKPYFIILGSLAALCISSLDSFIMELFSDIFESTNEVLNESISEALFMDNIPFVAVSIIYICVLGPLLEEVLCRGAILSLCSHVSTRFGIFVSALMFGIFHLNISQFFNAFLLGLFLGYITVKSGSIIPSTIMHILNNSLSISFIYITKDMSEADAAALDMTVSIILIAAGAVSLLIMFLINRKHRLEDHLVLNKPEIPEGVSENTLTWRYCFTRWSFFAVISFFIYSCIQVALLM